MADGSIDQLNYEIILKDNGFETKLKELEALAKSFNTNMSTALTISKIKDSTKDMANYSKAVKEAAKGQKDLNDQMKAMPASKVRSFSDDLQRTNKHLINTSNLMRNITQLTGVYFGAMGVRRFLSSLIEVTGQFEVQRMALRSMLQDADKADRIFGQFRQLALQSPYTFQEFAKFGKQLTAFNIPAENLVDTTKMLADVAAGLGVDMQRIILAYGQIKSAGVLKGTELRQLTEAGVPILDQLAKQIEETTGKTVQLAEVFDMIRKKQISFEMVEQAFREMTAEGGKFYNMQEVLVETLQGRIGKLKDVWQQALYDIGMSQEGILKGSVDLLTNIVANYDKLGRVLLEIVAGYGAYRTVLFALTAVSKGYTIAQAAQYAALLATEKAQNLLNTTLLKNPYAIVAAAVTALAFGIYKLATYQSLAEKTSKELAAAVNRAKVEEDKEVATLDKLSMKLSAVSSDTDEWKKAKSEVIQQFGKYSDNLDEEITKVGNLSTVYSTLRKRIAEAAKVKMYQSFIDTQTTNLTQISNSALDNYIKGISEKKLSQGMKDELLGLVKSYVYGGQALTKSQTYALSMSGLGSYLEQAKDAYSSLIGIDAQARKAFGVTDDVLNGLTKDAAEEGDELKTIGNSVQDIVNNIETLKASIKETRSKAVKGLTDEEIKKLESDEAALNNYMNRYKLVTGRSYEGGGGGGGSTADSETEERIKETKAEIALLRKYRDAYEKLQPYYKENTEKKLAEIFGNQNDYATLDQQISALIERLRSFGEEGKQAAESIETSLGLDKVSQEVNFQQDIEKRQQALEKYQKTLRQWQKDWGNVYAGLDRDIYAVIADYKDEAKTIEDEYVDAINEMKSAYDGDTEAIKRETEALDALKKARHEANSASAQEALRDLADKALKDVRKKLNMKDWGDKSFGQVKDIMKGITDLLADENFGVSAEIIEEANAAGKSLDEFFKLVKKGLEEMGAETNQENVKKIAKLAKFAASQIASLSDEIQGLGDVSKNGALSAVGDGLKDISSVVSSIAQGFAAGGAWGAAIAAIVEGAKQIIQVQTQIKELEAAIVDAREQARMLTLESSMSEGVESIFGSDPIQKVRNATKAMDELKKSLADLQKELQGQEITKTYNSSLLNPLPLETVLDNLHQQIFGFNANLMSRVNKDWKAYQEAVKKGYSGIESYIVKTVDKSDWKNWLGFRDEYNNLKDIIEGLGFEMYDEYGNLNAKALQAILDTYKDLGEADREWITEALHNSEKYAEAMKEIESTMESIFGEIASSAADTIVDGWIEAKNAALDYSDILDDVARSYSKMLVKSMVLDVLKDDESLKKITDAFVNNDTEKAMALIEGKMQEVAALEPAIQQVLQAFDPYFKREDTERQGLSKGIESNFSQDTIDYWSGQLTLLVEYAHRGDEQRIAMNEILVNIRDAMAGTEDGSYAANVQTYLATIQSDTSSIRADISSMRSTLQNMNDHGVRML